MILPDKLKEFLDKLAPEESDFGWTRSYRTFDNRWELAGVRLYHKHINKYIELSAESIDPYVGAYVDLLLEVRNGGTNSRVDMCATGVAENL